MDVKIETYNERVYAFTPYDKAFVARAKTLKGKWDPAKKAWHFDPRDEDRVRELCVSIFGTAGDPGDAADVVTVRIKAADHESPDRRENHITFAGRRVAWRPVRDEPVRLAPNVVVIEGAFPTSGGSQQYPRVCAGDDVILEVRDIPRVTLKLEGEGRYEIAGETIDVEALREERERLVARIAEIDVLLQGK